MACQQSTMVCWKVMPGVKGFSYQTLHYLADLLHIPNYWRKPSLKIAQGGSSCLVAFWLIIPYKPINRIPPLQPVDAKFIDKSIGHQFQTCIQLTVSCKLAKWNTDFVFIGKSSSSIYDQQEPNWRNSPEFYTPVAPHKQKHKAHISRWVFHTSSSVLFWNWLIPSLGMRHVLVLISCIH